MDESSSPSLLERFGVCTIFLGFFRPAADDWNAVPWSGAASAEGACDACTGACAGPCDLGAVKSARLTGKNRAARADGSLAAEEGQRKRKSGHRSASADVKRHSTS